MKLSAMDELSGQLGFVGGENRNRPGIDVSAVAKGSPADIAGIRPGDIIVAIDGVRLGSASKTRYDCRDRARYRA